MDIRNVDLNLLVVFDALSRQRSVGRAGETLGLSQPATSAALARLRLIFDDALFVRAGTQMKPTPRALELGPVVHRVVETINHEILQQARFDPARAERSFTLLTPDIGEVAFLPGVLRRLRHEAPLVRLRAIAKPPSVMYSNDSSTSWPTHCETSNSASIHPPDSPPIAGTRPVLYGSSIEVMLPAMACPFTSTRAKS